MVNNNASRKRFKFRVPGLAYGGYRHEATAILRRGRSALAKARHPYKNKRHRVETVAFKIASVKAAKAETIGNRSSKF
jgi:hypothetical protein